MTLHLTHEQLCDLILADSSLPLEGEFQNRRAADSDVVHAHLSACPTCSAEFRSLATRLSHFRDASVAYARQEFAQSSVRRSSIAPPHSYLSQPLYWTAAALVFVAALFPLSMHRQHAISPIAATTLSVAQHRIRRSAADRHRPEGLRRRAISDGAARGSHRRGKLDNIHLSSKDQLTCAETYTFAHFALIFFGSLRHRPATRRWPATGTVPRQGWLGRRR